MAELELSLNLLGLLLTRLSPRRGTNPGCPTVAIRGREKDCVKEWSEQNPKFLSRFV